MTNLKRSMTSDDSSEEDEPITEASTTEVQRNTLNNTAWMGADEEDEEEEDADWSLLAASSSSSSTKPITSTSTTTVASRPSIQVDDTNRSPRFKRLWASVGRDQYNTEAWTALMTDVQTFPIEEARGYYETFLSIYPMAGLYWKMYAEHEYRQQYYTHVETILSKALMERQCPCLEVWLFYLHFIKQQQIETVTDPELIQKARQRLCEAYELAIERLGGLMEAGPLWFAYLQFLQEDTNPQSFLTVRKVFHRVLSIPLLHMEMIWREYELFEKGIPNNEALAAGFFKVYRQKFDAARAVLRDRQALWQGIARPVMAVPVTSSTLASYRQAMTQWQGVLSYEMKNPERLPTLQWRKRLETLFEVVLSSFRYAPEIWYQYASFEEESKDFEVAVAIYKRGIQAIPSSSYLVFALADHYELRGEIKLAKALYENHLQGPYGSALVYITYQRFARRVGRGMKGIQESRAIFKRARKDDREGACTYHVYAAAAMLEFYSDPTENGSEIALNIFELGLKSFIHEPEYILCYLDFLSHLHDEKNMRSFFEKVLAVMPMDKTRRIWDRYVAFEHSMVKHGGDLATVAKVEARRALAFSEGSLVELKGLLSVYHRYSFLDVASSSTQDQLCIEAYRERGSERTEQENGVSLETLSDDRILPGPPMPEFLNEFASLLPLQQPWNGPIADVEQIVRAMLLVDFPPRHQIEYLEQQKSVEQEQRKEEEEGIKETTIMGVVSHKRPPHDVFRARQKQKLAKIM